MAFALPPPPFLLRAVSLPVCLLSAQYHAFLAPHADADGVALADVAVDASGCIAAVSPTSSDPCPGFPEVACGKRLLFPTFVDAHSHIDKGHTTPRSPNLSGSRDGALVRLFWATATFPR